MTSARIPAESKLATEATCRALKRDVDQAEREVNKQKAKFRSREQDLREIGSRLARALADLGLNLPNREGDLDRILSELDNLPDPFQPDVRAVRNLISDLRNVARDVTDIKIDLADAEDDFGDLRAEFARDCIGSA